MGDYGQRLWSIGSWPSRDLHFRRTALADRSLQEEGRQIDGPQFRGVSGAGPIAYSSLRAITGMIRAALFAGMSSANKLTAMSNAGMPTNVSGSIALTL